MTELLLTLSGCVDTLIAKGERSDDLRVARPGKSATQTPLATPSLARAGSGGSPKKLFFGIIQKSLKQ